MKTEDAGHRHPTDQELEADLTPPDEGTGKLLQRDYWAVIDDCTLGPRDVARLVQQKFWEFPPPELVEFTRCDATSSPLEVGDEMDVAIRMAGPCRVRILHQDANSITIGTVKGHPEAGRITFGAYRNPRGDVVFHIRSIARSGSWLQLLGFKALGEAMQTNTWVDFINKVASVCGGGVLGEIHADTVRLEADPGDFADPTFVAQGE